jgi:hypothetical protein
MLVRRFLAVLAVASVAAASSAIACGSDTTHGGGDASTDARKDSADAGCGTPADGGPVLVELSVTSKGGGASAPVTLVPAFSPDTHDYYVRCAADTNALTVSMTASACAESSLTQPQVVAPKPSKQTVAVNAKPNQAVVAVATLGSASVEYWVRCLPPDFPPIEMDRHPEAGTPTPGYYIVGNLIALGAMGGYAMVLDGNGVPVWYFLEPTGSISDVDHVTLWTVSYITNDSNPAIETHQIVDPPVETEAGPAGAILDVHELQVLEGGDYVVISNPNTSGVDLTGLTVPLPDGGTTAGGPGATINDCNIVELDPKTGAVTWTWSASDHFAVAADCTEPALAPPLPDGGSVLDAFHCNSIDIDPANGNLLVSARQMDSIFYIERSTGKVLWKMGGKMASIDDATYIPVASPFFGQHDARLQPKWSTCTGGQISLYDDETYGAGPSRGVLYDVTLGGGDGGCAVGAPGATVAEEHRGTSSPSAAGSFRISSDGSRVVDWGLGYPKTVFTEFDDKGHDLLDFVSFSTTTPPFPMQSFRAIKVPVTTFDLEVMRKTAGLPSP